MEIYTVILSKKAKENLRKVPIHIARKMGSWIDVVVHDGLQAIRKISGSHDEPLKVTEKASALSGLAKPIGQSILLGSKVK